MNSLVPVMSGSVPYSLWSCMAESRTVRILGAFLQNDHSTWGFISYAEGLVDFAEYKTSAGRRDKDADEEAPMRCWKRLLVSKFSLYLTSPFALQIFAFWYFYLSENAVVKLLMIHYNCVGISTIES